MDSRFLKACRREPVDATPIWFMRQAGRYLPQYRKIREKHDIISICKNPELCAEVTSLPVKVLGVDAAIMFADIMLPLEGMGVEFQIKEGIGPVINHPIRSKAQAEALRELDPKSAVPFVLDAIRLVKGKLNGIPLIGFCGGPFTLASYLIEGRPTRDFIITKTVMYRDPETWRILLDQLTTAMSAYLQAQVEAGVDAVQLFDSWIGSLDPLDYHEYVLPYSRRIFKDLEGSGVPRIHFGTDTAALLEEMREAGGDVFSVDWRIPIDVAWKRLGHDVAIQGNLDPVILLADANLIKSRAKEILARTRGIPGHIFNLGHGILADTPVENAMELVKFVHSFTMDPSQE
jgi:uroporphyrinogen decarboxylase